MSAAANGLWPSTDTKRQSWIDPFNEGSTIPFCNAHLYFNGWPFGIVTPFSGISGNGSVANEDSCLAAIRAETERVRRAGSGETPRQ